MLDHLTSIPGVPDKRDAIPGMGYFAGTGPAGKKCGDCVHRGYVRQAQTSHWSEKLQQEVFSSYRVQKCAMFKKMTGKHGADINEYCHACKYFEQKAK